MARPSSIPEYLVLPLLEQWELGKNAEQCSVWLHETHGIEASIVTINRRIKEMKDIQLQAKRDAVRANASDKALDYISMMDQDILKLNKITNRLLDSSNDEQLVLAKQLLETKLKLIDKQMNLTGMDKPEKEQEDQSFMVDGLINKLGKTN